VLDLFIATARGLGLTSLEHRRLTMMSAERMTQAPETRIA